MVCEKLGLPADGVDLGEWRRSDRAHPAAEGGGRDRARRQVRQAARRVSVGARGVEAFRAAPGLLRPRALGGCRGDDARGGGGGARAGGRNPCPRRVRLARVGREDPRLPRRSRAADSLPRHLPRDARRGLGVRPPRGRARGRQLDRDGSRDAAPGDRPAPRAEGDRGPRRHHAARRPGGRAGGGTRARRPTATRSSTSGTATATR